MLISEKLKLLSEFNNLEQGEDACSYKHKQDLNNIYVSHAVMPNGKRIRLFKSLITSKCKNNCYYCPMRKDGNHIRGSISPQDYALIIHNLYNAGIVDGAFISSGIFQSSVKTQDQLIDAAYILRKKLQFRGYLHIKLMPGIEFEQVRQSMMLADRVSLNLEAPNPERIVRLSPDKTNFNQLIGPLKWVHQIQQETPSNSNWKGKWPSACTQFVVGGADESDLELITTTQYLYKNIHLNRAYYSPFRPHANTPMESHKSIPLMREHRLYQASYLIRDYGFSIRDISFDKQRNLPLEKDPKQIWAEKNLMNRPIEINKADKKQLMLIPGIGIKSADTIIAMRKIHQIREISDLKCFSIRVKDALRFITLDGKRPVIQKEFEFTYS